MCRRLEDNIDRYTDLTNLVNPYILGAPACPPALVAGGWVEIGRTTLACAGDNITVSCLPYHRQYQVLAHTIDCGNVSNKGRINCDTGTNYAHRFSQLDGADVSAGGVCGFYQICTTGGRVNDGFSVQTVINNDSCKLGQGHFASQETAGAGTAPERCETVSKWDNDDNITSFTVHNSVACTNFAACSEVVILGSCNPDRCMNFWTLLACTSIGACAVSTMTLACIPDRKYYYVQIYNSQCSSGNFHLRYGSGTIDTGCNYAYHSTQCGTTLSSQVCQSLLIWGSGSTTDCDYGDIYILNTSGSNHLSQIHTNNLITTGAATPPERREVVGKWVDACPIDTIQIFRNAGCGTMDKGYIKVWGSN